MKTNEIQSKIDTYRKQVDKFQLKIYDLANKVQMKLISEEMCLKEAKRFGLALYQAELNLSKYRNIFAKQFLAEQEKIKKPKAKIIPPIRIANKTNLITKIIKKYGNKKTASPVR